MKVKLTTAAALTLLALAAGAGTDAPLVAVGDPALQGRTIGAYEATWTQSVAKDGVWKEVATLTERARPARMDGRDVLEHVQTTRRPDGIEVENTVQFDRESLAPMALRQEITNGPPQAPKSRSWRFEGKRLKTSVTQSDGQVADGEQELESPMFYGMTFGLVLAALPLREGYEAKLPVFMPQQGASKYWVIARVVGREPFTAADGKTVEAWAVETDWADFESGEVTSEGGAAKPGGAYYVVPEPPAGFPYVPKYANANIVIEHSP